MKNYKIYIGVLTLLYAYYIFSFPASFYNDDALFLSRGIDYFSIIDFSPHFPGYPFIILAGKFINLFLEDSKYSLFILSSSCAIFLPLVIFLYVNTLFNEKIAFISFLLCLSSPYLMNLSLSMLSDSVGLFFFFLSLYLLEIKKYRVSGIFFAISFFSRPSYMVFYLVGLIYLYFFKKDSLKKVLIWFLFASLVFLLYIFATQGFLYIYEAKRFILGHFELWGRGQNSDISWSDNIFSYSNLPFVLLVFTLFNISSKLKLLYSLFVAYLLWMIFAQNPDNIRHLIPIILIASIFISIFLVNKSYLLVLILSFNVYVSYSFLQKESPIDQIIKDIKNKEKVVVSNRSIEILREKLDNTLADNYYENSSKYLMKNKSTYLITTKKPHRNTKYKEYKGRFIGEHNFYLLDN